MNDYNDQHIPVLSNTMEFVVVRPFQSISPVGVVAMWRRTMKSPFLIQKTGRTMQEIRKELLDKVLAQDDGYVRDVGKMPLVFSIL